MRYQVISASTRLMQGATGHDESQTARDLGAREAHIQWSDEATAWIVRAYRCVYAPGDVLRVISVSALAAIGLLNKYP